MKSHPPLQNCSLSWPLEKLATPQNTQLKLTEADGRIEISIEQIIVKLREAEVIESKGLTQVEAAKKLGIAEQTLIRWRKEYGGLRVDQARRFKELEKENIRLKRLVADLSLDKAILKDAASGNL